MKAFKTLYYFIVRVLMSFGEERLAQAPVQRKASGEGRRSVVVRHICSSLTYKYHLRMLPVAARACAEDSTRLVDCDVDWILRSPGAPARQEFEPPRSAIFCLIKRLTVSGLRCMLKNTVADSCGK